MEDQHPNKVPVSDIEYDLATLSLKGRRFKEAGDKFMELVIKTQSSEAWCGLGLSRLGLLLESTTIDEVFYCFDKAKAAGKDKAGEIEDLVLQTATEAVGNLYNLYIQAVLKSRTAKYRSNLAMFNTALSTVMTMRAANQNRVMGSIAYAGITALSYDRYIDSVQTVEQMTALYNKVAQSVEDIKKNTRAFVTTATTSLDEFNKFTQEQEKKVVESLKTDAQRAEEQNAVRLQQEKEQEQRYMNEKMLELSDEAHPFHAIKAEAVMLYKANKYKQALPVVNSALSLYNSDFDLGNIRSEILKHYRGRDIYILFIPYFVISLLFAKAFDLSANGTLLAFIVIGILFGFIVAYRDDQRKNTTTIPTSVK